MKPISEILREHRKASQLTQQQVADALGITRSNYGSYEEGRAEPSIQRLIDLARFYNYPSFERFLELDEPLQKRPKIQDAYLRAPADKRKIVDFILNLC